jgi:hypothetical protein
MTPAAVYTSLKVVGYVVLLAMVGAIVFAGCMAMLHWSGIGV